MINKTKEKNGCWLEVEIEVEDIDHPISDLRRWLSSLRNILVTLYSQTRDNKGQKYLIELSSAFGTGLLFSLKKAVESRKEHLRTEGKKPDDLGVDIIDDSFRTIGDRDIINCWVESPIFDLVVSKYNSILQDYRWVSGNPSEYFFIYGNRDIFLAKLLPALYQITGNDINKIHWKFYSVPKRSRYEGLNLREDHYFNVALRKHYFESFDNSLLKELCCEIAKITGTSPKLDKLDDEMLSIATKAFATPEKATLEK